ncbi:MAG: type II toxin-antitoxin system RelE/ParE family toxin [Pseudomonadota bacterium]
MGTNKPRVFTLKRFLKDAGKEGIKDDELCQAIAELEEGKGENLGGNVWKKRLKQNRSRSIVLTKPKDFWVFAYLFAKGDKDNLEADELAGFKNLSTNYGAAGLAGMEKLVAAKAAMEICNECEDEESGNNKET